ncbi:corrinoid protein [Pseudoflavonifractor sp. DSM 107456]|uniref:Corrinoid protein n=1 Tax=Pseudoflavonifractor gallinarum TaxID=2779352 RepID=A0ABR9RF15_9FIRM|nr:MULTISPECIES: corrinoid protein [Eubacteriales]MBE5056918.1 corrinoid protein [Pseudoflavonifractor gallinarum]MBS5135405.1 corrinoid protein [Oscillospiraceae bacterium]MBT9683802.1 cobalamin-binding protein [Pseudoflavonifractor sp. MCC625]
MDTSKEGLLKELSRCVLEMEDDTVADVARMYASQGYDPVDGILLGLVDGMNRAATLYDEEEYFIPEMLICSSAMYNGLEVLRPLLPQESEKQPCKIIIGVVQGDTHDIGKNLVKIMLESAGYTLVDLGRDVPADRFVSAVKEENAQVVAMSTLMSTSMDYMRQVIEALTSAGLRSQVKVIVGGAPISPAFAERIGADGYSSSATEAVKLVARLVG